MDLQTRPALILASTESETSFSPRAASQPRSICPLDGGLSRSMTRCTCKHFQSMPQRLSN